MKAPIELSAILEALRQLDDSSIDEGLSRQFLEIEKSTDSGEIRINGNSQGLIHFARSVLEVATREFDGAHHHFDENGGMDRCDVPVMVCYKMAEWDHE